MWSIRSKSRLLPRRLGVDGAQSFLSRTSFLFRRKIDDDRDRERSVFSSSRSRPSLPSRPPPEVEEVTACAIIAESPRSSSSSEA